MVSSDRLHAAVLLLVAALTAGCRTHGREQMATAAPALHRPAGASAANLEAIARLPERDIDLTRALALIAHDQDRSFRVRDVEAMLARRAELVRKKLDENPGMADTPAGRRWIVKLMNRHVLRGLRPYAGTVLVNRPEDLNVAHVLVSKNGTCIGFTAAYLAVAQQARLPFRAVYTHRHVFVRYDDGGAGINAETVNGGRTYTDERYLEYFKLHPDAVKAGQAMRPLTNREFFALLLTAYGTALADSDLPRAARFVKLAAKLAPRNAVAQHNLATYLVLAGNIAGAQRALDAAIETNPVLVEALVARGHIHRSRKRLGAALADADAAVAADPMSIPARLLRADLRGLKGDLGEAAVDCRAALAVDRREPRALYLLARLHALSGNKEQALGYLKRAIRHGARDFEQMRRLSDFESIRDDPRFGELVGKE